MKEMKRPAARKPRKTNVFDGDLNQGQGDERRPSGLALGWLADSFPFVS